MIKIQEFSKPETELNLCHVIYMTIEKGRKKGGWGGKSAGRTACSERKFVNGMCQLLLSLIVVGFTHPCIEINFKSHLCELQCTCCLLFINVVVPSESNRGNLQLSRSYYSNANNS